MLVVSSELDALLCELIFHYIIYYTAQSCTFLQFLRVGIDLIIM